MFERYTERARRALFFARYEASQLGRVSIETDHLLLGVLRENKGLPSRIFAAHQMTYDNVLNQIPPGRAGVTTSVEIPFSTAAKNALLAAAREADRFGHSYIGTEHLLLGLLAASDRVTEKIFTQHTMDLERVRIEIGTLLDETTGDLEDQTPGSPATVEIQSPPRGIRRADTIEIAEGVFYTIATSVDGYIRSLENQPASPAPLTPSGDSPFDMRLAGFSHVSDAIVLDRETYAGALALPTWPFGTKPCWVVSNDQMTSAGAQIVITNQAPRDVLQEIERRGHRRVFLRCGRALASAFREANLIKYWDVWVLPIVLGKGERMFDDSGHAQRLELLGSTAHPNGIVENLYRLR